MEENVFKIERKYETETKTIRVPLPMVERLDRLSAENNVSVNGLIIQCVQFALDHLEADKMSDTE